MSRSLTIGDPLDDYRPSDRTVIGRRGGGAFDSDDSARRNDLLAQFPDVAGVSAGFSTIPVPSGYAAESGEAAWYGLQSVRAGREIEGEFALLNVATRLCAADPDAVRDSAWGDINGEKAAIVIGVNLPCKRGLWTNAPCFYPTLGGFANSGAADGAGGPGRSPYAAVVGFPPGKIVSGEAPAVVYTLSTFAPGAVRVRDGDRLDIALVCDADQIESAADDAIGGFAAVNAVVGLSMADKYRER